MSDSNLVPSGEGAKVLRKALELVQGTGNYLAEILADLPKDLVGLLAGDRVKAARAKRLADLWADVKRHLEQRGIADPEPPTLKIVIPILEAAADENREELRGLWARLMAAAMDPNRESLVRQSLITTVKQLDPIDVAVFSLICKNDNAMWSPNGRDSIRSALRSSQEEVLVSFENLERLRLISFVNQPHINPMIAPLGRILMRAVQ